MKRFLRSSARRLAVFTAGLAIAAVGMVSDLHLVAQDQTAAEPQAAAADEDLFKVPEGDADAIHKYLEKIAATEPQGDTQDEQIAFSIKALTSLTEAADRLLAAKPGEDQFKDAHNYRVQGLMALKMMLNLSGQDTAEVQQRLDDALNTLRQSGDDQLVSLGWQKFLDDRAQSWAEVSDEEKQAFHDEIMQKVDADGPQMIDVSIINVAAQNLDGVDNDFAANLLKEAIPKFEASDDEEIKQAIADSNLEGMIRRLTLLGNPLELKGKFLSGEEINWDSYRGKVVLVDFWATWCGPCKAELPNVLKMYEAYHDKGFDVVGVSLDDTAEEAKSDKLPWDSIFPENEDDRKFEHPLVKYYGITGIPTAILVDKEGKVVSMNARGPLLREKLQELLGDPVEKPAEQKAAATEAAAK